MSKPLFHDQDGMDTQRALVEAVAAKVNGLPEDRILNSDLDELAQYFVDLYRIEVPVLDKANISVDEQEVQIEVADRYSGSRARVAGVRYTVEIPFSGDKDLFRLRPNTFDYSPPNAVVGSGVLTFYIQDRALTVDRVKQEIDRTTVDIERYLDWHRQMWGGFDDQIRRRAKEVIETRRERLLQQKSVSAGLASLGFKLKEKPGDPRTYVVPAVKQKLQPQMPPMKAAVPPDPKLDRAQYETILGLIRDAGHSIEQSSSRTREMDEEALRDVLLVPLNAHFGKATGEAFNATGKTDILIKHEGGNLFVAECKFWHGEKQFLETIDQLLGYLTWRDTKTAVIMFNRNVGFSAVVEQTKALPKKHARYVSGPKKLDETSFEFTFSLPNDPDRHVTVSVMAFDLGPKASQ